MRRFVAAALGASLLLLVPSVTIVMAAELTGGCTMQVRSFDGPNATGNEVDEGQLGGIVAEGGVGSQSRPFKVDPEGSVDFVFTTGTTVFENNSWSIYAQGIPTPLLTGQDDNPLDLDERGVVSLGDQLSRLPVKVVGTFFISGDLVGNGGTSRCHGEGYVQVLGDPTGTPAFLAAVALLAISAFGLLVATPYSTTWETDPNSGERLRSGPLDRV